MALKLATTLTTSTESQNIFLGISFSGCFGSFSVHYGKAVGSKTHLDKPQCFGECETLIWIKTLAPLQSNFNDLLGKQTTIRKVARRKAASLADGILNRDTKL